MLMLLDSSHAEIDDWKSAEPPYYIISINVRPVQTVAAAMPVSIVPKSPSFGISAAEGAQATCA